MVVSWPISADLGSRVISSWEFQGAFKAKLPHLKSVSIFRFCEMMVYDLFYNLKNISERLCADYITKIVDVTNNIIN